MEPQSENTVPFVRMHGCGNDYVFLDCLSSPPPRNPGQLAVVLSDRRRSAGGDGLVLILPAASPSAIASMRMFNSDGSEGRLCGNALRCMAMYLFQQHNAPDTFHVEMSGQLIHCSVLESDPIAGTAGVRLTLQTPSILTAEATGHLRYVRRIAVDQNCLPAGADGAWLVCPGNEHLVVFVTSLSTASFAELAPQLEHIFPDRRVNVEFVEIQHAEHAVIRIWERGSGETLACGSGACAVAIAGSATGRLAGRRMVSVESPGGCLGVSLTADDLIQLEGQAAECCRGRFRDIPEFI